MSAVVPAAQLGAAPWRPAAAAALATHGVCAALVLLWSRPAASPPPEPVVLVELPPLAAPAVASAAPAPRPEPVRLTARAVETPIDVPPAAEPPPRADVALPSPVNPDEGEPLALVAPAPPPSADSPPAPEPDRAPAATSQSAVADRQALDYFARLSAHLNRHKQYPAEAKKARQQGVVTVRFTVDRDGQVSDVTIKRGSGHELLDRATLDLLRRVAPLPRMPADMARDRITLSLPIDYSLRTS